MELVLTIFGSIAILVGGILMSSLTIIAEKLFAMEGKMIVFNRVFTYLFLSIGAIGFITILVIYFTI